MTRFDAIIIGTGQSGPALAHRCAAAGRCVASIERKRFGGTMDHTSGIGSRLLRTWHAVSSDFRLRQDRRR